jgi:hypothetical protein
MARRGQELPENPEEYFSLLFDDIISDYFSFLLTLHLSSEDRVIPPDSIPTEDEDGEDIVGENMDEFARLS